MTPMNLLLDHRDGLFGRRHRDGSLDVLVGEFELPDEVLSSPTKRTADVIQPRDSQIRLYVAFVVSLVSPFQRR